jgi:hypothetical protein
MGQAPSNLSVQDIRKIRWGKIAVIWENYDTKQTAEGIFDISRDSDFMNTAVHRDNGQYIARIDPIRINDTNATLPYGSIWLFSDDGTNWQYIGDYGMQSYRILTIEVYTGPEIQPKTVPNEPKFKKKPKPKYKPHPKFKPKYSKPKYKPPPKPPKDVEDKENCIRFWKKHGIHNMSDWRKKIALPYHPDSVKRKFPNLSKKEQQRLVDIFIFSNDCIDRKYITW